MAVERVVECQSSTKEIYLGQEWIPTGKEILVTGFTGLVGLDLTKRASQKDRVIGISRGKIENSLDGRLESFNVDLLDEERVLWVLRKTQPDLVLHLAAATHVDQCEKDPELARRQNVEATKILAKACKETGVILGYCSTDYVFPKTGGPFSENDKTDPINIYGQTKLEGEKIVKKILGKGNYFIFRIASPYDFSYSIKSGTPPVIYGLLKENKSIPLVNDARTTYTWVPDIALALNKLILKEVWKDPRPIYYVAGPESLTAAEVAWVLLVNKVKTFGKSEEEVEQPRLEGISVDRYFEGKAPRPLEGGLKIDKIKALGIKMHSLEEVLATLP